MVMPLFPKTQDFHDRGNPDEPLAMPECVRHYIIWAMPAEAVCVCAACVRVYVLFCAYCSIAVLQVTASELKLQD